jgi:predicted transcriptional regulator
MEIMNLIEKRDYIHSHLHQINEPAINELFDKLQSYLEDALIEESEEDIKNGNLTSHEDFKQEVKSWGHTK